MILITGAGGTVGQELVAELKAAGVAFRAAHHSPEKAQRARNDGQEVALIDFNAPDTLPPALAGIDALFLLSGGHPRQAEQEIAVVRAAEAAGVGRVVKLSVWRAPFEEYSFARIHRAVERALESSRLAWTFLRANGFMQNFSGSLAGQIKARDMIILPAGDARVSHIDVRDIARVARQALTSDGHAGKAYELSGPTAQTYGEAAEILSRETGRSISYRAASDDAAKAAMMAAGAPEFYVDNLIDLFRAYRNGIAESVSNDVLSVTGRAPTSFTQFARDHADRWR